MGHKAIVVFDHDNLHRMKQDPAEFVRRLELAILSHRRTGGDVSMGGCTFANVVWSGHTDLTPTLEFPDFRAKNVTYAVQELRDLGFSIEPEGEGDKSLTNEVAAALEEDPAYWEVTHLNGKVEVLSAAEFTKRSFDTGSFKPLYF